MKSSLPTERTVPVEGHPGTTALCYPASGDRAGATIVLAHGAGAGQRSAFMIDVARGLAALGLDVVTFNFLYTEQGRRLPDRPAVLEACWRAVIGEVAGSTRDALFIGGKSMGGRVATQVAAADAGLPVAGLVLLGYPLHPPGRPDQRRDAHLPSVKRPMLFVQGSRDTFGTPAELEPVLRTLAPAPSLHVVDGGDHSFKRSRRDPAAQAAAYAGVQQTIAAWIRAVIGAGAPSPRRSS